jgi:WD40 repeat protein
MAAFDPYRRWLGIPPEEQPPDHYRLLGIGLFESDPDVISSAADRQMVHVRTFQTGEHSALSQQILNELASARVCLLDTHKKGQYDSRLRAALTAATLPPIPSPPPPPGTGSTPPPVENTVAPPAPPAAPVPPLATEPGPFGGATRSSSYAAGRRRSIWQGSTITIFLIGISLILLAWALSNSNSEPTEPPNSSPTKGNRGSQRSSQTNPARQSKVRPKAGGRRPPRGQQPPPSPPVEGDANGTPSPPPADPGGDAAAGAGPGEIRSFLGHTHRVTGVVFAGDDEFIFSASEDKSVRQWDTASGSEVRRFQGAANPLLTVACSPDGLEVLAVSGQTNPPSGGVVHIWATGSGRHIHRINISKAEVAWDAKFSPDGSIILLACEDRTIRLVDAAKRAEVRQIAGHDGPVRGVAFTPDGGKILSGSADQTVRLWDRSTGEEIHRMLGHQGSVTSVAISPDGNQALSGGIDQTVRLWNLQTGQQQRSCEGHLDAVTCVAYAPDGRYALSGSLDGTIRLWRLEDGVEVYCSDKLEGGIPRVAFSADGRRAVSAGNDGVVRLWRLPDDAASQ